MHFIDLLEKVFLIWDKESSPGCGVLGLGRSAMTPCPAPQAVVLEGNYWKRRIEVVMREYHKWRIYYKKRVSGFARAAPHPVAVPAVGWNSVPNLQPWLTGQDVTSFCQCERRMLAAPLSFSCLRDDIGCLLLPAPKDHTGGRDFQSKAGESAEKGWEVGRKGTIIWAPALGRRTKKSSRA